MKRERNEERNTNHKQCQTLGSPLPEGREGGAPPPCLRHVIHCRSHAMPYACGRRGRSRCSPPSPHVSSLTVLLCPFHFPSSPRQYCGALRIASTRYTTPPAHAGCQARACPLPLHLPWFTFRDDGNVVHGMDDGRTYDILVVRVTTLRRPRSCPNYPPVVDTAPHCATSQLSITHSTEDGHSWPSRRSWKHHQRSWLERWHSWCGEAAVSGLFGAGEDVQEGGRLCFAKGTVGKALSREGARSPLGVATETSTTTEAIVEEKCVEEGYEYTVSTMRYHNLRF